MAYPRAVRGRRAGQPGRSRSACRSPTWTEPAPPAPAGRRRARVLTQYPRPVSEPSPGPFLARLTRLGPDRPRSGCGVRGRAWGVLWARVPVGRPRDPHGPPRFRFRRPDGRTPPDRPARPTPTGSPPRPATAADGASTHAAGTPDALAGLARLLRPASESSWRGRPAGRFFRFCHVLTLCAQPNICCVSSDRSRAGTCCGASTRRHQPRPAGTPAARDGEPVGPVAGRAVGRPGQSATAPYSIPPRADTVTTEGGPSPGRESTSRSASCRPCCGVMGFTDGAPVRVEVAARRGVVRPVVFSVWPRTVQGPQK